VQKTPAVKEAQWRVARRARFLIYTAWLPL